MKKIITILTLTLAFLNTNGQSCKDLMDSVKSESRGTTYSSYNSDAISQVTFYDMTIEYKSYYFAIVCFKNQTYGCSEYIYQVGSNTKLNYSMAYMNSAGKAFWEYIQPYNKNLECGANFE